MQSEVHWNWNTPGMPESEPERKILLLSSDSSDEDTVEQIVNEVSDELKKEVFSIRKKFRRKKRKLKKKLLDARLKNKNLIMENALLQSELLCKGQDYICQTNHSFVKFALLLRFLD